MPSRKITILTENHVLVSTKVDIRVSRRITLLLEHGSIQGNLQLLLAGEYRNSYTPVNPACCMPICPPSSSAWPSAGSARRDTSTSRICSSSVSGSHPYTG